VHIFFTLNHNISEGGASGGMECGECSMIVSSSNYGSILLSFRDITMRWTPYGRRMDSSNQCIFGP